MRSILVYITLISVIKFCQLSVVDCCTDSKISPDNKAWPFMNTAAQDFAEIRHMPAYVDKTMLIHDVLTASSRLLLTVPRRFGKSVSVSMLKRFLEILPSEKDQLANRKLFENTRIAQCKETMGNHFGKYAVIFLECKAHGPVLSFNDAVQYFRIAVQNAYKQHSYLITSGNLSDSDKLDVKEWCDDDKYTTLAKTTFELSEALLNLAEYLFKHWKKKIFVLVDEYDSIPSTFIADMHNRKTRIELSEQYEIMYRIIGLCSCSTTSSILVEGCNHVRKVFITGRSYVMSTRLHSSYHLKSFRFGENHFLSKYYGLNRTECEALFKKLGHLTSDYDKLIDYYDGYAHGMISIWSVMNFLNERCVVRNYWTDSNTSVILFDGLRVDNIRSIIIKLLFNFNGGVQDNPVLIHYPTTFRFAELYEYLQMINKNFDPRFVHVYNVYIFLNLLLEQGYFAISHLKRLERTVEIRIPNRELKLEFEQQLKSFYMEVYRMKFDILRECASRFNRFNPSGEQNEQHVTELFMHLSELFETMKVNVLNEATFHHIVNMIACQSTPKKLSYKVIFKETKHTLDLAILTSKNVLIIIELKHGDNVKVPRQEIRNAEVGLYEILQRNYLSVINDTRCVPHGTKVEYYVLAGVHQFTNKSITICVLLNDTDFSNRITHSKMTQTSSYISLKSMSKKKVIV